MRITLDVLLFLFAHTPVYAETSDSVSHYSVGASVGAFSMLGHKDAGVNLVKKNDGQFYSVYVDYQTCRADSNAYDVAWGFPLLEGGIYVGDFTHTRLMREYPTPHYYSSLGASIITYFAFKRHLVQDNGFSVGYAVENGVSFNTKPYNKWNNVDNEFLGSRFSVYVGLGLYASYQFKNNIRTELGLDFKHLSNGSLDKPNKGANFFGVTLNTSIPLAVNENTSHKDVLNAPKSPSEASEVACTNDSPMAGENELERRKNKYLYMDASVMCGGKTLLEEWVYNYYEIPKDHESYQTAHYRIHPIWGISLAAMYRYSQKYASGIGLDYSYATYADKVLEIDRKRGKMNTTSDKHVLAIALRHECFYKQIALHMSIGTYLHRKMGYMADVDEKRYYETLGLKWYPLFLHNKYYVGYNVKAHLLKADCLELRLGAHLFSKR